MVSEGYTYVSIWADSATAVSLNYMILVVKYMQQSDHEQFIP